MATASKPPSGDEESDGYKVGYGKPPKANQFKKGQSGNPKGRKRKDTSLEGIIRTQLDQPVTIRSGDTSVTKSTREALLLRALAEASKGGPREIKAYFELVEKYAPGSLQPPPPEPSRSIQRAQGRPELHFPDPTDAEARLEKLLNPTIEDPDADAWKGWEGDANEEPQS